MQLSSHRPQNAIITMTSSYTFEHYCEASVVAESTRSLHKSTLVLWLTGAYKYYLNSDSQLFFLQILTHSLFRIDLIMDLSVLPGPSDADIKLCEGNSFQIVKRNYFKTIKACL